MNRFYPGSRTTKSNLLTLTMRTRTKQAGHIDDIIPMFVKNRDLRVPAWFRIVENLAVDALLGMCFINNSTGGISQSERKLIPFQSLLVWILSSFSSESSWFSDISVLNVESSHAFKGIDVNNDKGGNNFISVVYLSKSQNLHFRKLQWASNVINKASCSWKPIRTLLNEDARWPPGE